MTRVLALVLSVVLLAGCATIVSGTTQEISFRSVPPGATVTGDVTLTTPGTVELKRKGKYVVKFSQDGFPDRSTVVQSDKVGNWWVMGNVPFLLLGLIGIAIDAATGAAAHLAPEHVIMDMNTGLLLNNDETVR